MMPTSRTLFANLLVGTFAAALLAAPARGDVIMDWNAKADAIGIERQLANTNNARAQAMLHVAMFEAVNAIDRRYAPYGLKLEVNGTASREAAAASAAHDVLLALYPDQKSDLGALLAQSLSGIADLDAKANGIELGKRAAAGIVALRTDDGSNIPESYRPAAAAGIYVPTAIPIESTSAKLKPWAMSVGSQFRPGPPPTLNSDIWTRDLNEIREIGGSASTKRTVEQTTIARFWFFTGPRTYNPIVRQVASARKMDLVDSARLYALAAIAGVDAFIAVFDAKYTYNLWRPITAIRNADLTSNPATPRDASWLPLGTTPMHPEYPCAHCIVAAAIATVLQYSDEVSNARVYAGFHYRFSTEVGKEMGRKIGELTVRTQLLGAVASAAPKQ
jgi:hypothetical protein